MALETLKGVFKIRDYDVVIMDDLRKVSPNRFNASGAMDWEWFEKEIRPKYFIYLRHDKNSIAFTIQNGPVKEVGVNGCQVDELIETAKLMVHGLNQKFPCDENIEVITHLRKALEWLNIRRLQREKRGVEGYSKA